jgi:transcription termination/antitermination protein NusG
MLIYEYRESAPTEKAYGCVFCITGKEEVIANNILKDCPGVQATTVRQVKRKTVNGSTSLLTQIVFPGYVFLESEPGNEYVFRIPKDGALKLLTTSNRSWQLYGSDERFARWVFSLNGLISLSKAYQEGDQVKVISGPLKDLEGYILRVDKRNQSGQVSLIFNNRMVKTWLGFEYVERKDARLEEKDG